ncbi:DUF1996 domain-containing protein [Dactylosporangium sp. CA-152071]|uniref:DUF1996 domain-containing protein n=1 Tax=Dactylosporangium sp. CA-152071 TaxID=3239933 RepID=UPI003D8DF93E
MRSLPRSGMIVLVSVAVFGAAACRSAGVETSPGAPAASSPGRPAMGSQSAPGAGPSTASSLAPASGQVRPTRTFGGPPPHAQYQEVAANCTVTHRLNDDPIVFPGLAGASHNHTFVGNPSTSAGSTNASLLGGRSSCQDPKDASGYWFPTLLQHGVPVETGMVTVYYKADVKDYRTVLPFPAGFRLLAGDMRTPDAAAFRGTWSCGGDLANDIAASCPDGSSLIVRYQAPSCWNGADLDPPDHRSHMVYPVQGVCPAGHPVPLPMLELKVPYKLPGGKTDGLAYSSGPSYSFHFDFMNGWDPERQRRVIEHCVNGGRQCNGVGVDKHKP